MMLGIARGRLGKLSRFYNNLFLLTGGSVAGQLILLAAAPILTRLYTPRDLGIAGVYISILGFMSVGCMLRYEMAVAVRTLQLHHAFDPHRNEIDGSR